MAEAEQTRILVRVQPRAGRNLVSGFSDGVLQIRIAAPPVDGKANQELIRFLGDILGVSKSHLAILKGATSRIKTIGITGLTASQVMQQLARWNPPPQ